MRTRLILLLLIGTCFLIPFNGHADVQEQIAERNKQIEELQKQIADYQQQILDTSGKAKTLNTEISRLNALISKIQLEITSLNLSINQTDSEISTTQQDIQAAQVEIEVHKRALSDALFALYQTDRQSLTEILVRNPRLSDFFGTVKTLHDTNTTLQATIVSLKDIKVNLEGKQITLEEKRTDLAELKALQESQRKTLSQNRLTKDQLLKVTKGDESKYQNLLSQSKAQLERIRAEISALVQGGATVEDVVTYAKVVATRLDIRPAFLIGVLEVETRLGQNVGSGNWKDDMYQCYLDLAKTNPTRKAHYTKRAEDEKAAFFHITSRLGLDPDTLKVSKKPSYGCGGAMGPAQFIPTTWRGYEERIAKHTGHAVPNPWSIEDSFTAAAIKLANDGATAKTRAAEIRAAKSYISGNANCTTSICNYYANLALDKAALIEQDL